MDVKKAIKYLNKRDVYIITYGHTFFMTALGIFYIKDFTNYNQLKDLLLKHDI